MISGSTYLEFFIWLVLYEKTITNSDSAPSENYSIPNNSKDPCNDEKIEEISEVNDGIPNILEDQRGGNEGEEPPAVNETTQNPNNKDGDEEEFEVVENTSKDPCGNNEADELSKVNVREWFSRLARGENPWNNHEQFANKGHELENQEKYVEAVNCYDKAIILKSSEASYYEFRAVVHIKMGNLSGAILDLQRALFLNPDHEETRMLLCKVLFDAGRFSEAVTETFLLGEKELITLGGKLFQKGEFQETLRCYNEAINGAIKKKSSVPRYYRLRGNLHMNMHNLDKAILDFDTAVRLNPNSEINRINLKQALFKSGRYTEAIEETIALNETELVDLGNKFYEKHKCEEAIRCYTETIKINPEKAEYYEKRGHCYQITNDTEKAISDFRKVLELTPLNTKIRFDVIEILLTIGSVEEAMDVLEGLDVKNIDNEDKVRFEEICQQMREIGEKTMIARLESLRVREEIAVENVSRLLLSQIINTIRSCSIL